MSISAGAQAGISAGTQLIGMIGGHNSERRNYRNNRRLMELQHQNQMGLNRQGHDLQMDMWNKTNYGAQVEHMKNAGLNPALMYKGAGAGGTTGSQGGGSASMGSSQQGKVMDLQNMLVGAQIKDLNAGAKKKEEEAKAIGGYQAKESGARTRGIDESIKKTIAEVENLSQAKKNMIATEKLTVTQNEKAEIDRDIAKQNKKFYENNDLSEGDYGLIKALKRAGVDLYRAIQFVIYSTPEEAREVIEFRKPLD